MTPFLSPPFEGSFRYSALFDHDLPAHFDGPDWIDDYRGEANAGMEGHEGIDWPMPEGTPLRAVADGRVERVITNGTGTCPFFDEGKFYGEKAIVIRVASEGREYLVRYDHLSIILVLEGDPITRGQEIGFSGSTGCATGPHLHLTTWRILDEKAILTDPYGWAAQDIPDPWAEATDGGPSHWLWLSDPSTHPAP